MFSFLAVLTLWNTGVHVCATNSGNILVNIELLIDDILGFEFYHKFYLACISTSCRDTS